jgi:hypothetical protein
LKEGGEGAGTAKLNTGIQTTFITAAADQLSIPDSSRCGEVYRGKIYFKNIKGFNFRQNVT